MGRSRVPVTCIGRMQLYLFFMLLSLSTRALISRPPVLSPILLIHPASSIFPPCVGRCYKNQLEHMLVFMIDIRSVHGYHNK